MSNLYLEWKEKVIDGDSILTEMDNLSSKRIVIVEGDSVIINGYRFDWDQFFEVNHPIEIFPQTTNEC